MILCSELPMTFGKSFQAVNISKITLKGWFLKQNSPECFACSTDNLHYQNENVK